MANALLILQGVIFVFWAFFLFRSLFRIGAGARARADARGGMWPSFFEQFSEYAAFLNAPEYRSDRRRVGLLTVLLFATIFLRVVLITSA